MRESVFGMRPFPVGAAVRLARKDEDFTSVPEFAAAIRESTGINISEQQLYRIEGDKQLPTLEQYAAIALTLGVSPGPLAEAALPAAAKTMAAKKRAERARLR